MHYGHRFPTHSCSRPEWLSWLTSFEEPTLFGGWLGALAAETHDLGPTLHEAVVGDRLGGALPPLADCVEPIGQLTGDLGLAAELANQLRRRSFAARSQHADQVVDHLPRGETRVGGRVPVRRQLAWLEQAHLAAL